MGESHHRKLGAHSQLSSSICELFHSANTGLFVFVSPKKERTHVDIKIEGGIPLMPQTAPEMGTLRYVQILISGTCECDLVWRMDFADMIKVLEVKRPSWVGP